MKLAPLLVLLAAAAASSRTAAGATVADYLTSDQYKPRLTEMGCTAYAAAADLDRDGDEELLLTHSERRTGGFFHWLTFAPADDGRVRVLGSLEAAREMWVVPGEPGLWTRWNGRWRLEKKGLARSDPPPTLPDDAVPVDVYALPCTDFTNAARVPWRHADEGRTETRSFPILARPAFSARNLLAAAAVRVDRVELRRLLDEVVVYDGVEDAGRHAVEEAARAGRVESLELLLAEAARVGELEATIATAARFAGYDGCRAVLEWVAERATRSSAVLWAQIALAAAALVGRAELVPFLLEQGADPLLERDENRLPDGKSGLSPLVLAALRGHDDFVLALERAGVDVSKADEARLLRAIEEGDVDRVRALLRLGVSPNARYRREGGDDAVLHALVYLRYEMVPLLLDFGASLETATGARGESALYLAAYRGHAPTVRLLLRAGADATRVDRLGRSVFDAAASSGDDATLELLRARVAADGR